MRKTELLIPAGSLDVLKTAVIYGADAVYIGGEAFGLRAKAHNFSKEEMKEGIAFAHTRGVKVYVTANITGQTSTQSVCLQLTQPSQTTCAMKQVPLEKQSL